MLNYVKECFVYVNCGLGTRYKKEFIFRWSNPPPLLSSPPNPLECADSRSQKQDAEDQRSNVVELSIDS